MFVIQHTNGMYLSAKMFFATHLYNPDIGEALKFRTWKEAQGKCLGNERVVEIEEDGFTTVHGL